MRPRELVEAWVDAFNRADVNGLADFYSEDHVVAGKILFQRGYWDKLSFLRTQGLPLPEKL